MFQLQTNTANGGRSTTVFDSVGRAAASVNPLGNRSTTVFNSVGQTVGSIDPLGNRSTSVYDTAGRVVAGINPLGKRTTTVYNIASQSLATVDANGNRVSSVYDALGRRNVEINALGYRTTTIFDAIGQTAALVDARANRHSFTYDSTGAQTQLIDPLNRRTTSAYDVAGQQTLRIDARSNRTTYAYSSLSQLTSRKYPDGSRATFSYDEVGNRTLMADSTGRYTSVYDAVGQTMVTASPNNQRHSYSYDPIGTRRSLDASSAGRFTYAYDLVGQVTSLRNPYGERTSSSYDDAGRRTVQRNANGTRVSTVYDAASQTTEVIHRTSGGTSLLQLEYQYDNAGNRNGMIEGGGTARTTWSYDAQNQLTSEYRTGTNAYRQSFTFDPAGNRTLKNIDGARTTYAYDPANQLQYGQAAAGRTTFQYDLTGNQQIEQPPTGNRTTTTWNYENQPTQYLLPAGSPVTMAYNGDNRRVVKQQGADTTKFVWDSVIDAYVKELDGSNVVQAVYTNEPKHYGAVVSQRRGGTTSTLHADALGTTRLLTDSTQTATDTYLYDVWGNLITSSGTTVNPFRWVGRYGYYMDESTGMVYVRARMYQPTVASWASVDPLETKIRLLLSIFAEAFFYASNAGTYRTDPDGRYCRENACDNCDGALESFGNVDAMKQCLKKLSCTVDAKCVECDDNVSDGLKTLGCTLLNSDDVIVLRQCCDKRSTSNFINTWTHELLHAVRLCRKLKQNIRQPYNSCLGCLEEEIASYACSGDWKNNSQTVDELVKMAIRSCQSGDGQPSPEKPENPVPVGPCKDATPHPEFKTVGCTNREVSEIGNSDLYLHIVAYALQHYAQGRDSALCKKYLSCEDVDYPVIDVPKR